jgi:hypothetical protein
MCFGFVWLRFAVCGFVFVFCVCHWFQNKQGLHRIVIRYVFDKKGLNILIDPESST